MNESNPTRPHDGRATTITETTTAPDVFLGLDNEGGALYERTQLDDRYRAFIDSLRGGDRAWFDVDIAVGQLLDVPDRLATWTELREIVDQLIAREDRREANRARGVV